MVIICLDLLTSFEACFVSLGFSTHSVAVVKVMHDVKTIQQKSLHLIYLENSVLTNNFHEVG